MNGIFSPALRLTNLPLLPITLLLLVSLQSCSDERRRTSAVSATSEILFDPLRCPEGARRDLIFLKTDTSRFALPYGQLRSVRGAFNETERPPDNSKATGCSDSPVQGDYFDFDLIRGTSITPVSIVAIDRITGNTDVIWGAQNLREMAFRLLQSKPGSCVADGIVTTCYQEYGFNVPRSLRETISLVDPSVYQLPFDKPFYFECNNSETTSSCSVVYNLTPALRILYSVALTPGDYAKLFELDQAIRDVILSHYSDT